MLTKDELLYQCTTPNIREISLALYKDFSESYLMGKIFKYYFEDNTTMDIEFREWGIYHMLSIQHIDGSIKRNRLFESINKGLDLSYFNKNKSIAARFKNQKERITMYSCIYHVLKEANVFYLPSGKVKNTKRVEANYIIFSEIGSKGMNVGLKSVGDIYVPITILISRQSNKEIYIEDSVKKIVRKLEILDIV